MWGKTLQSMGLLWKTNRRASSNKGAAQANLDYFLSPALPLINVCGAKTKVCQYLPLPMLSKRVNMTKDSPLKAFFLIRLKVIFYLIYPPSMNSDMNTLHVLIHGAFFTSRDGKINTATFVCVIVSSLVVSLFKAYQSCSEPASPLSTYSNTPTETGAVCYYFR